MVDPDPPAEVAPWVGVVTGGNSGIGEATARELARRGATTILACRNQTTAASAARTIRAASGNEAVHTVPLDLADLHSVSECAQAIRERAPEVQLLLDNAGGAWRRREVSVQGVEASFAVNHLGHYALTRLLLDVLRPGARVVNVTSEGHRFVRGIQWDDIGFEHGWRSIRAYAQAKLAQILVTRDHAPRRTTLPRHGCGRSASP